MWIRTIYNDLLNADKIIDIKINDIKSPEEKFVIYAYLSREVPQYVLTEADSYSEANLMLGNLFSALVTDDIKYVDYFTWREKL